MNPPSKDHSRASIHAYVCEDLRRAKVSPFYTWTEATLGLSSRTLLSRAQKIAELKWFEDEIVQDALIDYARARVETNRYDPFVHLSNRIIELARGALPGVGKTYPINDFCLANGAMKVVDPTQSHGPLAARRRPDIVGLSTPKGRKLYKPGGTVGWPDILMWGELKFWRVLVNTLNNQRTSRGLLPLDEAGIPEDRPTRQLPMEREGLVAKRPNTTARRRKAKSIHAAPKAGETKTKGDKSYIKVGRKRLAQENLLANIDKSSSAKRRHSTGPSAEIHDNASTAIQSSSYALELLSGTQGTRVHCFGFVLKDDRLSLWYYDASGIVYTQEFISIIDDFEVFAALIIGFASCTIEQFGVMPLSVLHAPRSAANRLPVDLEKRTLTMTHPRSKQEVLVSLDKVVFAQYSLMGRRTFLYTIKTKPGDTSKPLIAKFSYQVCTRKAEQDLVAVARRAGVKHLPRIHMWAELWKLSNGVRQSFHRKSKGAAAFEDRTLRVIVYTQYASIKELFSQSIELIPVMVIQMIDCLHDLRYKASMLHRDISINNIMYQMRNGRHHFVLIDFDMAIVLPAASEGSLLASSSHRTGTLPFMACELIANASLINEDHWKPIPHALRHDYESLFWVALWCILALATKGLPQQKIEKHDRIIKEWETGTLSQIAGIKVDLCTKELSASGIVLAPAVLPMRNWFNAWGMLILEASNSVRMFQFKGGVPKYSNGSNEADEVWETAGGKFTRDNLKAVLMDAYPTPLDVQESVDSDESEAEDEAPLVNALDGKIQEPAKVRKPAGTRKTRHPRPQVSQPLENDIRSRLRPRRPRV